MCESPRGPLTNRICGAPFLKRARTRGTGRVHSTRTKPGGFSLLHKPTLIAAWAFGKKKAAADPPPTESGAPLKTPTAGTASAGDTTPPPATTTIDMEKTKQIQTQIDEVQGIMQENINTAKARGENLDDLAAKTQDLELGANQFSQNSAKVKKNLWWKNMKMTIGITVIVLVILACIVGYFIWSSSSKN